MKTIRTLLCLLAFAFLYSGCEKGPFDYRKKYAGDYTITYRVTWYDISGNHGDETNIYDGSVSFEKTVKRKIRFHYDGTQDLEINKKGELFMCEKKIGEFESKDKFSYKFHSGTCGSYPHGGSGTFEVSGVRK